MLRFLVCIFLVLSASACRSQEPIPISYSSVTRPSLPIAFIASANGHRPNIGRQLVVRGIGTELAVGGGGSVSFAVPPLAEAPNDIKWSLDWLEAKTQRGWHAEFTISLDDFPVYDRSRDVSEMTPLFEKHFGFDGSRGNSFLFRFEPHGALIVLTEGSAFIHGELTDYASWDDYVVLAEICAERADDVADLPLMREDPNPIMLVEPLPPAPVISADGNIEPPKCQK